MPSAVKAFTKAIADAMALDSPERYIATITKAKRHGKILIDYLRNQRGATAVAPYSPRARPGAPGRSGFDAARLGGTQPRNRFSVLHDYEHTGTAGVTDC